jgi:hypothetical protein
MDVDALATTRDRRKAYVGMTRAKYDLYVLGQPEALALIRGEGGYGCGIKKPP